MHVGIVKWFNESKGYGYIVREEDGAEVFVHFTAIEMDGYRSLKKGQSVKFECIQGEKGLLATRVVVLNQTS